MYHDDGEFVKQTYNFILNREPDKDGFDFWLSELSSKRMTRSDLIKAFISSKEFLDRNASENGIYNTEDSIFRVNSVSDIGIIDEVFANKSYQHNLFQLEENDIVLDLGAHIGAFTVWAHKQAKNVSIIAYEPHERNYKLLLENIKLNDLMNVKCFNQGVMGIKKSFVLKDPRPEIEHTYGYSFVTKGKKLGIVECTTLDEIGKNIGFPKVIKMDAEGSEFSIFETATKNSFKNCRCIAIEYHGENEFQNHNTIVKKLEDFGFSCVVKPQKTEIIGMIFGKIINK